MTLTEALERLLPVADDQRPWDAARLKEYSDSIVEAEQALKEAGYQEETK